MAEEEINEKPKKQEQNEEEDDSSLPMMKGTAILVAGGVVIVVVIYALFALTSNAADKPQIEDAPPMVQLFEKPVILTRKVGEGPMDMKRWVVEPPTVILNKELKPMERKEVSKAIKSRRTIFKSKVDSYLKQRDLDFVYRTKAKETLAAEMKTMLEEEGIPPGWIKEIVIPSFQVER